MSQRPHGRKRNDQGQSASAHRRGDGIGGGSSNSRPSGGGGVTRGVGGLGILAIAAMLLFGNGGGLFQTVDTPGSSNTTTTTTATVGTPTTPAPANPTPHQTFNFGTAASHNNSAVNASSTNLNTNVNSNSREKYTTILGNGQDQMTIMVYMCGTDLESNYGMATSDLNEMAAASHSDKVNIIVETGGTKRWKNNIISNQTNQRYQVLDGKVKTLDNNVGSKAMTDAGTLTNFIQFCTNNFPANRYMLIFWDHGGGSVSGYGYDEKFPNGSMTVDRIATALKNAGTKFDIIGFDACLMANMECAMAVEPYGDYLLASEETEPGTGWYYTEWLTQLANNSSMSSLEIGKRIVDDFVSGRQAGSRSNDKTTLSLVDLAEFKNAVPTKLSAFSKKIVEDVQNNNYQAVADARSVTREFSQSNRLDQIDLVDFCLKLNTTEGKQLAQALQNSIKYNRARNINNAYGLSVYFPYRNTRYVNSALRIYNNIAFDEHYAGAVRSFANLEATGQIAAGSSSSSIFDMLGGASSSNGVSIDAGSLLNILLNGGGSGGDLSSLLGGSGAVDTSSYDLFSSFFGRAHIDSSNLVLTEKNGQQVLSLSEEEWSLVQNIKLNVWVDDGTGYIDLGMDNIFEFNEDGDLIIDYDKMWVAINGQPVAYYMLSEEYASDDDYSIMGYVPAFLNDEEVHLIIEFSDENEGGIVLGAESLTETDVVSKITEINEGDTIDFICDYYDYDGNFNDRYLFSEQITVNESGLEVTDVTLTNDKMIYGYVLTDIYDAERRTPMVNY